MDVVNAHLVTYRKTAQRNITFVFGTVSTNRSQTISLKLEFLLKIIKFTPNSTSYTGNTVTCFWSFLISW